MDCESRLETLQHLVPELLVQRRPRPRHDLKIYIYIYIQKKLSRLTPLNKRKSIEIIYPKEHIASRKMERRNAVISQLWAKKEAFTQAREYHPTSRGLPTPHTKEETINRAERASSSGNVTSERDTSFIWDLATQRQSRFLVLHSYLGRDTSPMWSRWN